MSRCFPFPPPGYKRKTITDDPDLLKKEKDKEKKHKKEKRDKEKKEAKEKREKDRSDDKHREKRDKKDKHKDKKKDKEKHRDKDKNKTDSFVPDGKRVVGLPGPEVPISSEKTNYRANDRSAALVEKRAAGLSASQNGELVGKNNHVAPETKSFKYAPELGWRSTDEQKRTINQTPDKNVVTERKKDGVVKLAGKSPKPLVDGKERSKVDGRTDDRGVSGEVRSSGGTRAPNSVGMVQNRVGGAARPMEKKIDQRVEGREKIREKEGNDAKVDKRKENDREKPIHKENDKEGEKRKEEKVKATNEQKHVEQPRMEHGSKNHLLKSSVKDGSKKDFSGAQSTGLQNIPRNSNHSSTAVNNLGKRKDIGLNGIYDEHTIGPNKLARTTTSTHPTAMENGRSLEPCQNSVALAPATQRPPVTLKVGPTRSSLEVGPARSPDDTQRPTPTNIKVEAKEQKINGMISRPSQSTTKADRKADAPPAPIARPPHPDTRYLSQVLSVPKLDEWTDFDDQEWLFSSSSQTWKKPEVVSSVDDIAPQVWAKALWLEPVDIHALPYVIPH